MPAQPSPPSSVQAASRKHLPWVSWLLLVAFTGLAALAYALYSGAIDLPERYEPYNPWAPIDVASAPNWLTGYKLERARSDPPRCLAALGTSTLQFEPVPDRTTGPGCGFDNAVRVSSAGVQLGGPLTLSCPMALSFAMWEQHALQPAAMAAFEQPVVAVEHFGSYACRNINTGEGAAPNAAPRQRSRHATADALDVSGVLLKSGKRISVLNDFKNPGNAQPGVTPEAQFLNELHAGACRYFDGVLGPDYNAVHRNHFHLETGGYRMCR